MRLSSFTWLGPDGEGVFPPVSVACFPRASAPPGSLPGKAERTFLFACRALRRRKVFRLKARRIKSTTAYLRGSWHSLLETAGARWRKRGELLHVIIKLLGLFRRPCSFLGHKVTARATSERPGCAALTAAFPCGLESWRPDSQGCAS